MKLVVYALLLGGLVSCDAKKSPGPVEESSDSNPVKEVVPTLQEPLPAGLFKSELARAREGDVAAMRSLEEHYLALGDMAAHEYWLRRQYELQSPDAWNRLANLLEELGGQKNCREAEALLRGALATNLSSQERKVVELRIAIMSGKRSGAVSCEKRTNRNQERHSGR